MRMRDKQKELVRSALTQAGIELYESRGFANTTIDQITKAAGVAKGTFYNYFETKEDLLVAGMAYLQEKEGNVAEADILLPSGLLGKLSRLIDWSVTWIKAHPELSLVWSLERLRRGIKDDLNGFDIQLRAIIASGQQSGELRKDRSVESLLLEITALFVFAIARWVHNKRQHDLAAAIKDSVSTYLSGAKGPNYGGEL